MSSLLIYEDTEQVLSFEGGLPDAGKYPTYTYGYVIETGKWYRIHMRSMGKGNAWMEVDHDNPEDGTVPKTIRAMVLLMGGGGG